MQSPIPLSVAGTHDSSATCYIDPVEGVKCWGLIGLDQCDLSSSHTWKGHSSPEQIPGLTSGVMAVAIGPKHRCALTSTGAVWCWGCNRHGSLGDGTGRNSDVPVEARILASRATAVAVGNDFTCVVSSGAVYCWGDNGFGQLGNGTRITKTVPTLVSGLESGVVSVSASWDHACALKSSGELWCWGANYWGQIGIGTRATRAVPTPVSVFGSDVVAVEAFFENTCALKSSGELWCWGMTGTRVSVEYMPMDRDVPTRVVGLPPDVAAFTAGFMHTCVLASGGVWCLGSNTAGYMHTCVLPSGGVWCLGSNDRCLLGIGSNPLSLGETSANLRKNSLTPVVGLTSDVVAFSAGTYHTCAVKSGGAVWCWGSNYWGQLGDGTTTDRCIPVLVPGTGGGRLD